MLISIFYGLRIVYIAMIYQLDVLFLPKYLCLSRLGLPWVLHARGRACAKLDRGERLALALEVMGPLWVKFGQVLSTRQDIIPFDIATSLARLQDAAAPFDVSLVKDIIAKELGAPVGEIFNKFDLEPLASASVAQVHAASLAGADVVVKVIRPRVRQRAKRDIRLLNFFASLCEKFSGEGERLRAHAIVMQIENRLKDELNLRSEAANCSMMKNFFPDARPLYVPKVYWDYTTRSVMVLERIHGISINNIKQLTQSGVNLSKLATKGVELFFTQVFEHGFFHADMHPGNIFINIDDINDPFYEVVDFGIVSSLSRRDKLYIAQNLLAFFQRDYAKVANLHVAAGWVPSNTDIFLFEQAIRTACEPIFARPLAQISFGLLFLELLKTARAFKLRVQPQLFLLQKTLLSVESLGRKLDPNLDLWQTAEPYLAAWVAKDLGLQAAGAKVLEQAPAMLANIPKIASLMQQTLLRNLEQPADMVGSGLRQSGAGYRAFSFLVIGAGCMWWLVHMHWVVL